MKSCAVKRPTSAAIMCLCNTHAARTRSAAFDTQAPPTPNDPRFPRKPANGCSACGQDFGSLSAFDAHLTGRHAYLYSEGLKLEPPVEDGRRCFDVEELTEKGWNQDSRGRWRQPGASFPRHVTTESPSEPSDEEEAA